MPLWICTSAKDYRPAVNSTFEFFTAPWWFGRIFCTFSDYLLTKFAGPYNKHFLLLIHAMVTFSLWSPWECADQSGAGLLFLLFLLFLYGIFFALPETQGDIRASNRFLPLSLQLRFSTTLVDTLSIYGSFLEVFLDQRGFPLSQLFEYTCFFSEFTQL